MAKIEYDEAREHRITMEAVVDCYGAEEQAMGWYYYLDDKMTFPFPGRCRAKRISSPLTKGETVEVTGMAPTEECGHDMLVLIQWQDRPLAVPLSQLAAIEADADTLEAIGDWHYWVARGYEFG